MVKTSRSVVSSLLSLGIRSYEIVQDVVFISLVTVDDGLRPLTCNFLAGRCSA
jgi:hypothetical protein